MNLDPAKLLVILVIGLLVLGPERLPRVARQLGHLWREFTGARDRLINEFKEQVPDLPNPRSFRSVPVDPGVFSRPVGDTTDQNEFESLRPLEEESRQTVWSPRQAGEDAMAKTQDPDLSDPSMN